MTEITITLGDMLEVLHNRQEGAPLYDSAVTDPPYHLTSIVKRFGGKNAAPAKMGKGDNATGAFQRVSRGFMGKEWDGGDIAFRPETWRAVYDALKPGAFLVAFSGSRTYHRMACAIEDAGFEIRDQLQWVYASGMPKGLDVSKAIDKVMGVERGKKRIVATKNMLMGGIGVSGPWREAAYKNGFHEVADNNPITPEAKQWEGWNVALKPSHEPICLARKPISEKTVAANVLKWGTGALNIDSCRVGTDEKREPVFGGKKGEVNETIYGASDAYQFIPNELGRWPANIVHDSSDEVNEALGHMSRFFASAKAGPYDRIGTAHPTVKPVDLMRWLVRLVTPKGGLVLEPFAGSGATLKACKIEGMSCHGIDIEPDHVADIERTLAYMDGMGDLSMVEMNHAKIQRRGEQPDIFEMFE